MGARSDNNPLFLTLTYDRFDTATCCSVPQLYQQSAGRANSATTTLTLSKSVSFIHSFVTDNGD